MSAVPFNTSASFHERLTASRKPEHMPWPMKGGVVCAASPTRRIRPVHQEEATVLAKV